MVPEPAGLPGLVPLPAALGHPPGPAVALVPHPLEPGAGQVCFPHPGKRDSRLRMTCHHIPEHLYTDLTALPWLQASSYVSRRYELEMTGEPSLAKVICLEVAGVYQRHAAAIDAHLLTQLVRALCWDLLTMCVATASRCRTSSAKRMSLCRGAFAAVVKATGKADHRPYALKVVTRSAYRHYYHMMNQVLQPVYHRFLPWSHVTSLNAMAFSTRSRSPDVHRQRNKLKFRGSNNCTISASRLSPHPCFPYPSRCRACMTSGPLPSCG